MSQPATPANRIITLNLEPNDPRRLANLCGQRDEHLKLVESRLGITLRNRGNIFQLAGPMARVKAAANVLEHLYRETEASELDPDTVHLFLQESGLEALEEEEGGDGGDEVLLRTPRTLIKPRGLNQQSYVQSIRAHDINFGIGPAGTGKTYLAVAAAVEALNQQEVRRILLVRPAVEAGEKLGFLPGDLAQKIDPYLRPLYDALRDMLDPEMIPKLIEAGVIEVAPLAYMRGRTLNDAFVILDEAQNTTPAQMKMFLTRLGFGSKMIVTGDITQVDLPTGQKSGLRLVRHILRGVEGIHFSELSSRDVVRHSLVGRIVDAYDTYEEKVQS